MVRSRGYAEYAEASEWRARRPRRPWLRTARLNVVGWSALLGVCLVSAAAGLAATAAFGVPGPFGAVCAVVPLVAVVLVDRRRWAGMRSSYGWGGSVDDVARVVVLLQARGLHVQVVPDDVVEGWGEPATASLEYFNRDAEAVRGILRAHGIRPPDLR